MTFVFMTGFKTENIYVLLANAQVFRIGRRWRVCERFVYGRWPMGLGERRHRRAITKSIDQQSASNSFKGKT